MAGNEQLH